MHKIRQVGQVLGNMISTVGERLRAKYLYHAMTLGFDARQLLRRIKGYHPSKEALFSMALASTIAGPNAAVVVAAQKPTQDYAVVAPYRDQDNNQHLKVPFEVQTSVPNLLVLEGGGSVTSSSGYETRSTKTRAVSKMSEADESLSRLILGVQGIGRGTAARGYIDALVGIHQGDNDLWFANFVPSGNYRLNQNGVVLAGGYRHLLDDGTVLGIIPSVNLNQTKYDDHTHMAINAELLNIFDGFFDLNLAYIDAAQGDQLVKPGRIERPLDGLLVQGAFWLGNKKDVALISGYDGREDCGATVGILLDAGFSEITVRYGRVNDEDMLFVDFGNWSSLFDNRQNRISTTNRMNDPIRYITPIYSNVRFGGEERPPTQGFTRP